MKHLNTKLSVFLFFFCLLMVINSNFFSLVPAPLRPISESGVWMANKLGLTQAFQMFAIVGRYGTDLQIEGTNGNDQKQDLTSAILFPPGFLNQNFFNHKSGKLLHLLVYSPPSRATFLDYLCRTQVNEDHELYRSIALIGSGERLQASTDLTPFGERRISLYLKQDCASKVTP